MNKYVIWGGAGFIGSNLSKFLLQYDVNAHDIIIIDNLSSGKIANLPKDDRISFYESDLRNIQNNWKKFNFSHIEEYISINLCGYAPLHFNEEYPQEAISNNIGSVAAWLDFHREFGVKKAIFASTNAVYENTSGKLIESYSISPDLVYPLTKKWGEELCCSFSKNYDMPILSLRLSNIYGPSSNSERKQPAFFSWAIRQCLKNEPLTLYNSNSSIKRDYLHVEDLCTLIYLSCHKPHYHKVYNACSGESLSTIDILKYIQQYTNSRSQILNEAEQNFWNQHKHLFMGYFELDKNRVVQEVQKDTSQCSNQLACQTFKWAPKILFQDGIKDVIKSEMHHEGAI